MAWVSKHGTQNHFAWRTCLDGEGVGALAATTRIGPLAAPLASSTFDTPIFYKARLWVFWALFPKMLPTHDLKYLSLQHTCEV